jgi:methylated-DNA-[protein]-cysteine S-methyltransferase
VIAAPFGRLGIKVTRGRLTGIDLVSARTKLRSPTDVFTRNVCRQLNAYFSNSRHVFTLPLALEGTAFQTRVWHELCRIRPGAVRRYADIADRLDSGARAVGGACRRNPVPIVVPCHRVISNSGLGGYMGKVAGAAIGMKQWLLTHERVG